MGIMDKIQEGLNKGKELVNKTVGGQHSAQTTAAGQDAPAQVTDTSPSAGSGTEAPTTSGGSEAPVEPTSES